MKYNKSLIVGLLAISIAPLEAVTTIYTSRAPWTSALAAANLGSSAIQNFDSLTGTPSFGAAGTPLVLVDQSLSISSTSTAASANDNIVDTAGISVNVNGSAYIRIDDNVGQNLMFSTTSSAIRALGFDYSGFGGAGEGLTATIDNGGVSTITVQATLFNAIAGTSAFFGFIDDNPSNVYQSFNFTGSDGSYGIDDITVAATVPEPSSLILFGLGAFTFLSRRSRS